MTKKLKTLNASGRHVPNVLVNDKGWEMIYFSLRFDCSSINSIPEQPVKRQWSIVGQHNYSEAKKYCLA